MKRLGMRVFVIFVFGLAAATGSAAETPLNAAQIVAKNLASRGGAEAWRKIHSMVWVGHIETTHAPASHLPFVLELKRPDKTRFEIRTQNAVSVRVFDGTHGWKMRPSGNGRPRLQPYSATELRYARDGQEAIGGPLLDYTATGTSVVLDGMDKVDGRDAYRLTVTTRSGTQHHVWIDAKSFLDIMSDRESRNAFGQTGTLYVHYRNFRRVGEVTVPLTIESGARLSKVRDKMAIDRVVLNPALPDWIFARAGLLRNHYMDTVAGRPSRAGPGPVRVAPTVPRPAGAADPEGRK